MRRDRLGVDRGGGAPLRMGGGGRAGRGVGGPGDAGPRPARDPASGGPPNPATRSHPVATSPAGPPATADAPHPRTVDATPTLRTGAAPVRTPPPAKRPACLPRPDWFSAGARPATRSHPVATSPAGPPATADAPQPRTVDATPALRTGAAPVRTPPPAKRPACLPRPDWFSAGDAGPRPARAPASGGPPNPATRSHPVAAPVASTVEPRPSTVERRASTVDRRPSKLRPSPTRGPRSAANLARRDGAAASPGPTPPIPTHPPTRRSSDRTRTTASARRPRAA